MHLKILFWDGIHRHHQVERGARHKDLEKGMETQSSILAWKIPWTEKPGGSHFMGLHRVRYDWVSNTLKSTRKVNILCCTAKLPMWMHACVLSCSAAAAAKSLLSCPVPCDPMDCSLPGSSVHGILQARIILVLVSIASSRGSSPPRDQTRVSCIGRWILYCLFTREALPCE